MRSGPGSRGEKRERTMSSMVEWVSLLRRAAENFSRDLDPRELDFSVASIGRLDDILVRSVQSPEAFKKIFVGMWTYLAEVLIRQYGCRWGTEDGQEAKTIGEIRILPPSDAERAAQPLRPMDLLTLRFHRDVSLTELAMEIAYSWFADPSSAIKAEDSDSMRHVADIFVAAVRASGECGLDYTPESVFRLDDLIDKFWGPKPEHATYEAMVPAIGAYLGEVLVDATAAQWVRTPDGQMAVQLGAISAFPMNKVGKRFDRGREHSITQFYREISQHWSSGNEEIPATWKSMEPPQAKRGLLRRG